MLESYITHIKIIEDGAYPSSPAPPNSSSNAKKPRLVVIAVRKSGRVRMHKCRENVNGTFSIGKTWALDDLTAIQSYSGAVPTSPEEAQQKEWAGAVGFTVTMGKPYYWQAYTQKEKQFFIGSLVKIFTKYTGGRAPDLVGFEARERDQLLGISAAAVRTPPASLQAGNSGMPYGDPQNRRARRDPSREPALRNQPSRDAVQRSQPQIAPNGSPMPSYPQTSRTQVRAPRGDSPSGSIDSNGNATQQNPPGLRKIAGSNQSQESFTRSEDGLNQPPRSRAGVSGSNGSGRFQDRSMTPTSQRTVTPEGSFSSARESNDIPSMPVSQTSAAPQFSERRRPPIPNLADPRQRDQNSDNLVPAPLSSPSMRRDDLRPPTRSSERSIPRNAPSRDTDQSMDGALESTATPASIRPARGSKPQISLEQTERPEPVQEPEIIIPPVEEVPAPSVSPPVKMPDEPVEESRPGLGPMIKKKSRGDIAGQFFKAAQTAAAFKPRAGGAADRLLGNQAKLATGPDGITGVVPAPSLLRSMSGDDNGMSAAPIPAAALSQPALVQERKIEVVPEVKITVPPIGSAEVVEPPLSTPSITSTESAKITTTKRTKLPPRITMAKEIESLGIDPNILGDRGGELVEAWDQFGFSGTGIRSFNVDKMIEDANREMSNLRTGSWLKLLEDGDSRIGAIQDGFDKCIAECDELDGLLTLYSVELGVSDLSKCRLNRANYTRRSTMILHTLKRSPKVCRFRLQIRSFFTPSCHLSWRPSLFHHRNLVH